jgi:PKD repeat protein
LEVDFNASYNAPAPSITTYSWVFGNGQTSSIANPENILFNAPGSYSAALTTTISTPTLEFVTITGLSDAWFSELLDEELFGFGAPDPYFLLINGNSDTVYTSESIANTETPSWTLSPITLNDPPYSIVFFDDDPFSDDDYLGAFSITLGQGPHTFSSAEGTAGSYTIGQLITTQITDSTTIQVFPLPDSTLTLINNIATVEEQNFTSIVWFQDGELTDEFIASTAALTTGGVYSAQVTNVYGCSANTNSVTYCAPVTIEYIPPAQELYVSEGFASYQWYFNGIAMKGGNNYYINTNEPGNYSVTVTTDYGCVTESSVYILIISVEEQENTLINLFPIPARELINVQLTTPAPWAITDITGRTIMADLSASSVFTINIESLPVGVYFLQANESRIRFVKE